MLGSEATGDASDTQIDPPHWAHYFVKMWSGKDFYSHSSSTDLRVNGERMSTTVLILNFLTDRSGQTVQTQIRLLLEEQSDLGLHCLLFHLHVFDKIPSGLASFV